MSQVTLRVDGRGPKGLRASKRPGLRKPTTTPQPHNPLP